MGKEFEHRRAKVFYSKRRSIIIELAIALLNGLRTSIRGLPSGRSSARRMRSQPPRRTGAEQRQEGINRLREERTRQARARSRRAGRQDL